MHTGDAEEQALFERLEREFADVRVPRPPRGRRRRPRTDPGGRRGRFSVVVAWLVPLSLGGWSLSHSSARAIAPG